MNSDLPRSSLLANISVSQDIETLELAVEQLAERLLRDAQAMESTAEARQARQVARLMEHPAAKTLTMAISDRTLRSVHADRAASAWRQAMRRFYGLEGFAPLDRSLLWVGKIVSSLLPDLVMGELRRRLREDSRAVILPAETDALAAYLNERKQDGFRLNMNPLGEAVHGEEEASRRLSELLALLDRPDVDYVSAKISAIYSQIHLLDWDHTISCIQDRLRPLYRTALLQGKFVNLDMEEYRDLGLTLAAFRQTLDEPEFHSLSAGVVLQAYLPDSWQALQDLATWALERQRLGRAAVKVRLVKGANLAMERVEAEWHGWSSAPYATKTETDANFRRMLEHALEPSRATALHVGVASHNLFDVALALILRQRHGLEDYVGIEMLEGMANPQARAVRDAAGNLLLYSPIVKEKDFPSALAYLVRRLDENTAPENFLSDLFTLRPGNAAWERQKERFLLGWRQRCTVSSASHRLRLPAKTSAGFHNAPDTDWSQPRHRQAWQQVQATWQPPSSPPAITLDSALDVVSAAKQAQPPWGELGDSKRIHLLHSVAQMLARRRMESIWVMQLEGKKNPLEADTEVSEAIDFANYYAETFQPSSGLRVRPRGVVVIAPPWNFPFAIPCGGILAALVAGNTVILKPSPEVPQIAYWLVQQMWEAGIPREVLHFAPCPDDVAGPALVQNPAVDAVVLTGSYETAALFRQWRPSLPLFAETSGKNAIVVSALADRDLAIRDLVRSSFSHSGQKCSASSLGILEAEVYDDPDFMRQLRDAAASLSVGSALQASHIITPLILPPGPALYRALTMLEPGESWLLEPRQDQHNPSLWSPGIKLGLQPGSWYHQTECFGPVLGLMRAQDLDHAVTLQNATPFGLTAGFHSLDEEEIDRWKTQVQAGNLYINRAITGAIVQRQPFGGWKRSSIGPGAKAGGPNYVALFRHHEDMALLDSARALASYEFAWADYFSQEHDPSGLLCESNVIRYHPSRGVVLRLPRVGMIEEKLARYAADLCGVPLMISHADQESDTALAARLPALASQAEFFRTLDTPADDLLQAAYAAGLNWIQAPISGIGRLELTRWLREQAVSETRHRYGNIIPRPDR